MSADYVYLILWA